jgi:hypothetical protein
MAKIKYSAEEAKARERLMNDFPHYAENVLKIRPKKGGLIPFRFNQLQIRLHQIIEKQREATGKVRIIIVKGRQGGCSTYTEARFYHKTTHQIGKKAFILTHLGEATANLYGMVQRFYDNTPLQIRPHAGVSNTKELIFDKLDSGYRVSTAGAKGTGRSDTIHYFHGSEVAFWEKAEEHAAGVLQAAKAAEEIILESTANGMNNWFYQQWIDAVAGKSEFIPVFLPWFIEVKYRKELPEGFVLTTEEEEYKALYNLDDEQMCWRRSTESELGVELFKQEYPANPDEAFQFSPIESFIKADNILKAMKRPQYENMSNEAIIGAYDPAVTGKDRDAYCIRQGCNLFGFETPQFGDSEPARIAFCKRKLDAKNPRLDRLFIDAGGGGYQIFSHLRDDGYSDRVRLVKFGAPSPSPIEAQYVRDQMFVNFNRLLTNPIMPLSINIKNAKLKSGNKDVLNPETAFLQDATATGYKYDAHNRPKMESKDTIRIRLKMSTDLIDVAIMTTAEPVIKESMNTTNYHEEFINDYQPWHLRDQSCAHQR